MRYYGILWDIMGYSGKCWDIMEYSGILWNILAYSVNFSRLWTESNFQACYFSRRQSTKTICIHSMYLYLCECKDGGNESGGEGRRRYDGGDGCSYVVVHTT